MTEPRSNHLEPRVARLESGLDSVAKDMVALTSAVQAAEVSSQQHYEAINSQLHQLSLAMTKATGPREYDIKASVNIGISVAGLVIVIGGLVLWPMQREDARLEARIVENEREFREHEKMEQHPVGQQRIDALEISLRDATKQNDKNLLQLQAELDDIKTRGLPVSTERIVILEQEIKRMNKSDNKE